MKRQLSGVVSSGMTQEMDDLGVSEGEGEGEALSTQEIDESARAWYEAQVVLHSQKNRNPAKTA